MNTKTLGQILFESVYMTMRWEDSTPLMREHYESLANVIKKEVLSRESMQRKVAAFNRAIGHPVPEKPTVPDEKIRINRINLIQEELAELAFAMNMLHGWDSEKEEHYAVQAAGPDEFNITETIDAIADLLYVVFGAATDIGIDIAPFFDEVHRSNMSKIPDGHRSESGKWIKGPNHSPADIAGVFKKNYPDFEI